MNETMRRTIAKAIEGDVAREDLAWQQIAKEGQALTNAINGYAHGLTTRREVEYAWELYRRAVQLKDNAVKASADNMAIYREAGY